MHTGESFFCILCLVTIQSLLYTLDAQQLRGFLKEICE